MTFRAYVIFWIVFWPVYISSLIIAVPVGQRLAEWETGWKPGCYYTATYHWESNTFGPDRKVCP